MIISNSAECTKCDDEVISVDPVKFTACKCSNVKIKGGLKEIFHTWIDPSFYKRKIIVIENDANIINERKVSNVINKLNLGGEQ